MISLNFFSKFLQIFIPLSPGLGIFSTSFGSSVFLDFEDFADLALPIRLDFALPLLPLPLADVDRSFFFDAEPCLEFLRKINYFSKVLLDILSMIFLPF